jgi:hypothetical protein
LFARKAVSIEKIFTLFARILLVVTTFLT